MFSLGMALLSPVHQASAQMTGVVQDPGLTPPLDADVESCLLESNMRFLGIPGEMPAGPMIVRETDAQLLTQFRECVATRGAKLQDFYYRKALYLKNQLGMRFMTAIYGGLIDASTMIAQRIAYEAAQDILTGNPGNEPRFWNSNVSTWLENATQDSSSKFIDRLDVVVGDWTQSQTAVVDPKTGRIIPGPRFSFCSPPDPYSLKLSLGIGEMGRIGPGACNLKKVADNFRAIGDMIGSGEALQLHRPSVQYGASDLSVGVQTNSDYFNYMLNQRAGLALNRQEDHGLKPITDIVSGKIQIPTVLAENSYRALDPITMTQASEKDQKDYIMAAYFQVGMQNIPMLALQTFSNTLIVGLMHKWLDPKPGVGLDNTPTPQQIIITADSLKNADATGEAQDLYERQEFAKALGDYLIPNFSSTADQDIMAELTTCSTPRKTFNCAMDQALGVAINVGTREGALTVGRAAGVGNQGSTFSPSTQALHAAWELIPENDLKNNTDPTCAQRAYCAGNLKKMRLARILPIGWEMAANSPYNIKHSGKYITLKEVIQGFYSCNDKGEIDKDHPWCHLIDPNWILTAPKYQCRATGFGNAILPEVGTRLEECGDMISCLKSNQNGECIGGYGYCLAERPVWKFDVKECDAQFVSCRTYQSSKGQISLLRNTEDKGKCSVENIGCQWYATNRYVTSTASPDGLWVGTVTSGPRVYLDKGIQSCSSEGCTKVYRVNQGQQALNLVHNGSFEQTTKNSNNKVTGFPGWQKTEIGSFVINDTNVSTDASEGSNAFALAGIGPDVNLAQNIPVVEGRNYVFSYSTKYQQTGNPVTMQLRFADKDGNKINYLTTVYGDCQAVNTNNFDLSIMAQDGNPIPSWTRKVCQFVSPPGAVALRVALKNYVNETLYDAIQLEEGEVVTPFMDGLASGLAETYLKIAPDEYQCTGDDTVDHPGCKRFARVCRQVDVGCQGYKEVNDFTAPEVPAILSTKDLCPAVCAGYGEYRKLASTFDLVKDPAHKVFDDPQDETTAYFIPSLSEQCTLEDVGCEPFTSMEASTSTGEKVAYYKDVRLCEKPNNLSATYYTWEGSETTGYQLKTWSLMADTTDVSKAASSPPKLVLRGGSLGYIKDPASCNDVAWKLGSDPDCRQFYDVGGSVYYIYYSQTISSDAACTNYRKDDSTEADCVKTGGTPDDASKSCTYHALPAESQVCSEVTGGCRAYLGPTGRNSVNVYRDTFATGTTVAFDKQQGSNTTLQYSNESVLVGDRSLKLQAPFNAQIDASLKLALSSTSSLLRVSFWAKANTPGITGGQPSRILVDGVEVGNFYPDINWARFEAGPFMAKQNPTVVEIIVPSKAGATTDNIVYIDTFSVDQLNDVQFVRKNHWAIPAACDATPEGVPESRYMVGCREYNDRNSNSVFVRNFNRLCRDTAIGCSAFVDSNDKAQAYSETKTIKGTALPQDFNQASYPKHGAAKMYEEQFYGDWSATSRAYRYYYAIDDARGRCDASQASCRAYGKPVFQQDRLQLASTTSMVGTKDAIYKNQKQVYGFETVLLKDNWNNYLKDNGDLNLACRKDELFCDQFQSGNITEFFRDPGNQTCVWGQAKKLKKNDTYGIPSDGEYSGWFRDGTEIPCYGSYLSSGNTYLLQYTGEIDYAGWGGKCPVEQSECTELVDPNDSSDPTHANGKSYYVINGPKLDKSSCGGTADPLSGCILFQDKGVGTLEASSQATYAKVMDAQGTAQTPLDCDKDPENKYCVNARKCKDFEPRYNTNIVVPPGDSVGESGDETQFHKNWTKSLKDSKLEAKICTLDTDCNTDVKVRSKLGAMVTVGYIEGKCPDSSNDANIVLKVKMDRECSRWMGCRTGETVYDATQNKFVTQCTEMNICEQNGSRNDDIYCAKFTDRNSEDLLNFGQFINAQSYSGRQVGFGKMDYSGLVAPDHYLVSDIKSRAVGYDLLNGTKLADRYRYDQRAVAEVPTDNINISLNYKDANFKVSGITLCQDIRTKRVGYRMDDKCILPIGDATSLMLVAGQTSEDTSRDVAQLYQSFESGNTDSSNNMLQGAMPMPECQIYPEETSPLPNSYVAEWNTAVNPPTPKKMVEGFERASACVYKEDCSCSYRKVRYTGGIKYYALDGAAPAVGVCMGGDLDGQSCVPGGYVAVGAQNKVIANSTVKDTCKGGACMPIQDVVSVFGKYGYCLERDLTRISAASQATAPCLTWSPMAVLGGQYDVTHRSPTAGYQPPQGMGEYYCASGANVQKLITPNVISAYEAGYVKHWASTDFITPGNQQQFAYSRPDVWWNNKTINNYQNVYLDGSTNLYQNSGSLDVMGAHKCKGGTKGDQQDCTQDADCGTGGVCSTQPSQRIVGNETKNMQYACRRASLCEGLKPTDQNLSVSCDTAENRLAKNSRCQDANNQEGLWIQTGGGFSRSYLEYFIPYRPSFEGLQQDASKPDAKYFDYHFGLFRFGLQADAIGSACKWNPKWFGLDYPAVNQDKQTAFSCTDFLQQVQNTSNQITQQAQQSLPLILDRGSEKLLSDPQGTPYKLGCLGSTGGACYFKYWQAGFNDQSQNEFNWIDGGGYKNAPESFKWDTVFRIWYGQQCRAGKPYFAIRAIFQNVNSAENSLEPDEARFDKLSGPWQFIGFWVTTCMPNQVLNDPGLMYLRLDVVKADVCKEVAQVIAPYTRESAAFADRVWAQGRFILPVLGIQYVTPNEPFGSALATGNIDGDPMLMGASVPLSGDYLKAPTFVDSGVGAQSIFNDQQNSWMPLSNLFARIYKIYRWSPFTVNAGDWACIKGDKMANKCSVNANSYQGLVDCGDYATCSDELDLNLINQDWRCNALSGVNRGLSCGLTWSTPTRNSDPTCHNAAVYANLNQDSHVTTFDCNELNAGKPNSSCILANPGCEPANSHHQNFLSYKLNSKDYDPSQKNFTINFKPFLCPNNNFYALPTLEAVNMTTILSSNWYDASMLLYGALQLSLRYDCVYHIDGSPPNCVNIESSLCQQGQSDKSSVVGILAELNAELTGAVNSHEMRDAFKASFGSVHPKFNGIDSSWGLISPVKTALDLWVSKGVTDKVLPVNVALGTWPMNRLGQLIDYKCSADAVNAGHRCLAPGALASDLETNLIKNGQQPVNGSFYPYVTLSCPKRIDPCGTQNVPKYPYWVPGNPDKPAQDQEGLSPPACGYCSLNDPTGWGSSQNDQYFKKMPKDANGKDTGYCVGFNKKARCSTNTDCTFSNFEYWGAHHEETRTDGIIGYDYDNLSNDFPLLYLDDTIPPNARDPEPTTVNLPRPLFDKTDLIPGDPIKDEYRVPPKYSEPAVLTTLSNNNECILKPVAQICSAIYQELYDRYKEEDSKGVPIGYVDMKNGQSGWSKASGVMGQILKDAAWVAVVPGFGLFKAIGDISDPSTDTRKSRGEVLVQGLVGELQKCQNICNAGAILVPNGYAAHFEDIIKKSVATPTSKPVRTVSLAPFVVNPLWEMIRSLGYSTNKTGSYCEQNGDFSKDNNVCCQGSSFQASYVTAYFLKGLYYQYNWRFQIRNITTGDGCGATHQTAESYMPYINAGTQLPGIFNITSKLAGSFIDTYSRFGLLWTNGFDHRLQDLGKSTLVNDIFPWKVDDVYFTSLFPLLDQSYDLYDVSPAKILYNGAVTWFQYMKIWSGFGYSVDLKNAFENYLTALQVKTDKQAALATQNGIILSAVINGCDNTLSCPDNIQQQKEYDAAKDVYDKVAIKYEEQYKKDMQVKYFDKTGWGTLIDVNDPRLQLYPGAIPAAMPLDDKAASTEAPLKPVFISGHCEPPKNGTDFDSKQLAARGVDSALQDKDASSRFNLAGKPAFTWPAGGDNNSDYVTWYMDRVDIGGGAFTSAWHDTNGYYNRPDQVQSDKLDGVPDGSNGSNGYSSQTLSDLENIENYPDAYTAARIVPDPKGKFGEDMLMPAPMGNVGKISRTTCRCDGGEFDGQAMSSILDCNSNLKSYENPFAEDSQGNLVHDPNTSYSLDPSAYCKPVSQDNGKPTPECQAKSGTPGSPDPNLDDNLCTHLPGYVPRGDVCADGRDQCLTTYNLHDSSSVDSYLNAEDSPVAPSATDVTTGLDTYHFLTGCGANGCDLKKGHILKDDKQLTASYKPIPPLVAAPDMTKSQSSANAVPVAAMNAFTLNNLPQGLLFTGGGESLVTMRFYAWTAHNQGPIKKIVIDWGDGTINRIDYAQMKNQKPVCNTDRECELIPGLACSSEADCPPGSGACRQTGYCKKQAYTSCRQDSDCDQKTKGDTCEFRILFGNSPDACRQGYLEFGHVYKCDNLSDIPKESCTIGINNAPSDSKCANEPNLTCDYCKAGETCIKGLAPQGGCFNEALNHCRFTPRLMVFDNWGWCTGDCSNPNDGKTNDRVVRHPNGGCYDGSQTKINSEVMSDPATSKVISSRQSAIGNNAQECSDQEPLKVLNTLMSKDDPYLQRRPWIVYQGSVELQAGPQALKALNLINAGKKP